MSYCSNDGFTEHEIACGIPAIFAGYDARNDEHDSETIDERLENLTQDTIEDINYFLDQELEIVNSFTHLKLKNQLLLKITHKDNIDDIIDAVAISLNSTLIEKLSVEYCNTEGLAFNLIPVARSSDCIERLVLNVLHKYAEIPPNQEIKRSVELAVRKIKSSDLTAYYRTKEVQELVHRTTQDRYGKDSHLLLPSDVMRKTLSTSRLHFFIDDLNNKTLEQISRLIEKSDKEVQLEFDNNSDYRVSKNKKHIKNWNLRHKKAFTAFIGYSSVLDVQGQVYELYREALGLNYQFGLSNIDFQTGALEQPEKCKNVLNAISIYYISLYKKLTDSK